jgi:TatA/E family protein of Tat protein translocase
MEFFGMGALEILLILIVGFIVFGPAKLPQLARNLGKGVRTFRKAASDLTAEVTREFQELEEDQDSTPQQHEPKEDGPDESTTQGDPQ